MSRTARVTAPLGGEDQEFCLKMGELIALEEKLDAGTAVILYRLTTGQWRVPDVIEVLRYGLIGGGMDNASVARMIRNHVEARTFDFGGPEGLVMLAVRVLAAATHGVDEEEPLGKSEGKSNGLTTSPMEKPDGEPSSAALS